MRNLLDKIKISCDNCEVSAFMPKDLTNKIYLDTKDGKISESMPPYKVLLNGELEIDIKQNFKDDNSKKKLSDSFVHVPIVWVVRTKKKMEMFPILTPYYVKNTKNWDLPVYHYEHPAHLDYLKPLLWPYFDSEKKKEVEDISTPSNLWDSYNEKDVTCRGIFYPQFNLRDAMLTEEEFYLYNFTSEPVDFFSFTGNPKKGFLDGKSLKVKPKSKKAVRAKFSKGDLLVSMGNYRVEWLWL